MQTITILNPGTEFEVEQIADLKSEITSQIKNAEIEYTDPRISHLISWTLEDIKQNRNESAIQHHKMEIEKLLEMVKEKREEIKKLSTRTACYDPGWVSLVIGLLESGYPASLLSSLTGVSVQAIINLFAKRAE